MTDPVTSTAGFGGLGLSGDGGGTWFLPHLVGTRRAAEPYFGPRFPAGLTPRP